MMSLQRNYYEVMGLPSGATTDQIKKKYRELARQFHPDVVQDKVMGQRVFTQINQAYSVLGNPERRAQYNGTLQQAAPPPGEAAAPKTASPSQAASPPQAAPAPRAAAAPQPAPARPASAPRSPAFTEMLSRAENAIMAGKPVEARAFCVRILEADPRHVRAMELLGDALVQMGRREEAAVQYRQALQVAPSTMIQAKLNRVTEAVPSNKTLPPRTGSSVQKTVPPAGTPAEDTDKPGLFGRLLGRK